MALGGTAAPMPNASSALDGPPPSPQSMGGGPTGAPTPFSLSALAPPSVPSAQMPPEMLTAIMQSAQKIAGLFDSYAQATPDLASDWAQLKDQLSAVLAKLTIAGSAPTSPAATGSQFPAAFDRGTAGAGSMGAGGQ